MHLRQGARWLAIWVAIGIVVAACATVEPSPEPSRSPSPVQASPNPKLVEFEGRVADALAREGQLVRGLGASSAATNGQLRLVAVQLGEWAAAELSWLREHDADPCYAAAADAYNKGLNAVGLAAGMFTELASASTPPSGADAQLAGQSLSDGTTSLEQAATLAREARVDCS
jgi:hypothetical protein